MIFLGKNFGAWGWKVQGSMSGRNFFKADFLGKNMRNFLGKRLRAEAEKYTK